MTLTANTSVGALATAHPATIKVFQRYGIDYCCGGSMPIRSACTEHGAPLATVLSDLTTAMEARGEAAVNWRLVPLSDLIDHILGTYHAPQRAEFARLGTMLARVMEVHGGRWPALLQPVAATFDALRTEADAHTRDEERRVFPAIAALEKSGGVPGSLDHQLDSLEREHATLGALLADLERRTDRYQPPEEACNTFRGLYHGLAELADGLREHVALENHVLFPRAAALARSQARS